MVRTAVLYGVEAVCLLALLYGVALVYVPAAWVLGGLLGVVAVERAHTVRPLATRPKEPTS
ncbi:hypothetical protein ACIRPU_12550 [Streptomyces sp. NPDC102259]|uniref:hypothetical protein n=1 Tax=Streptomyces sp. NPDC102259 TaxID=3366148 RepID=UPI0038274EF7